MQIVFKLVSFYLLNKSLRCVEIILLIEFSKYLLRQKSNSVPECISECATDLTTVPFERYLRVMRWRKCNEPHKKSRVMQNDFDFSDLPPGPN